MVDDIPLGVLFASLVGCLVLSAFFSGSETGMMALNRYRLRNLVDKKHRAAMRAYALLERPDRLVGLILLGNNLVNIIATSTSTIIGVRLLGEAGLAVQAVVLTITLLIFSEVLPKTLAALHPERVAFPATLVLTPLLRLCYPFVWFVNLIANGVLRVIGVRTEDAGEMALSREELRTVVKEAGAMIPRKHQQMLFAILDLERITVEDIMVPRHDVTGINLETSLADIEDSLVACRHTRVPAYRSTIDNVVGILHVRNALRLLKAEEFTVADVERILSEPYYVPSGTPLHTQLINFQRQRRRMGLVVNEYGDIVGLVTLEDLLEEIVGEFTTDTYMFSRDIQPQADGSYLVDGGASIRELNRQTHWNLPTDGPKTLNGLIIEALEDIPEAGTSVRIGVCIVEIVQTTGQAVKTARVKAAEEPRAAGGSR
ncbi:MAG: HlyC/CorC family transporter [Gammaproteobacteria bacterium]|nr:HlyC/CorC family transporter [Gammaproteobacteria bacterium]